MSSAALGSLAAVAAYLGGDGMAARDPSRLRWRRDEASPVVELHWDEARRMLRVRAPLDVDAARFEARALAVAVAEINLRLEVFGVEFDAELAFVSHAFFDADGTVSSTDLERLLAAVDECAARTETVIAGLPLRTVRSG